MGRHVINFVVCFVFFFIVDYYFRNESLKYAFIYSAVMALILELVISQINTDSVFFLKPSQQDALFSKIEEMGSENTVSRKNRYRFVKKYKRSYKVIMVDKTEHRLRVQVPKEYSEDFVTLV